MENGKLQIEKEWGGVNAPIDQGSTHNRLRRGIEREEEEKKEVDTKLYKICRSSLHKAVHVITVHCNYFCFLLFLGFIHMQMEREDGAEQNRKRLRVEQETTTQPQVVVAHRTQGAPVAEQPLRLDRSIVCASRAIKIVSPPFDQSKHFGPTPKGLLFFYHK
jgi:hypothetical protein